jgi:hypothetical protein
MPTNANTFNSRVTSEALEAKFRDVFPAQGGAELVQDLFASGVIQPVVDFSSVAEGSVLPEFLQTAWDYATGISSVNNTTTTIINTTGFWKLGWTIDASSGAGAVNMRITDGVTPKTISSFVNQSAGSRYFPNEFIVFVDSGHSVTVQSTAAAITARVSYRQIADINGNLVNPLGFTFS